MASGRATTRSCQNDQLINLEESERFVRYLQGRMDFIAQVATSSPAWSLSTAWNPFFETFTSQYCLLDNIVWSYQLRRIQLQVRNESAADTSLTFDLPHGGIGGHAFFTILENMIRNAVKYNQEELGPDLNLPGVVRFDAAIEHGWADDGKGWADNFYRVRIRDSFRTEELVVDNVNRYLAKPIVNPLTGAIEPGQWGIKEIKICAAYLRLIRWELIDRKFDEYKDLQGKQPPLVHAALEEPQKGIDGKLTGKLTYYLYLLRPRER